MTDPHSIGVRALSQESLEGVSPRFVNEGLLRARAKTISVLAQIREGLRPGMTEDDARKYSLEVFASHGVKKHWHKPYLRFGPGTALTFHDPLQPDYRLREGDPYYIDLGPVWADPERGLEYEGDYGDTFVLGVNREAENCARAARELFAETCAQWKQKGLTGEQLYAFAKSGAEQRGYRLAEAVDGHRLSDFPHHKYSKERLAGVAFQPSKSLWVLEIQIVDAKSRFGAFFEDILR
jgi:Xaa-Pro aminopeptidase